MELEMRVHGVFSDLESNTPILILKDAARGALLSIWVGQFDRFRAWTDNHPASHDARIAVRRD